MPCLIFEAAIDGVIRIEHRSVAGFLAGVEELSSLSSHVFPFTGVTSTVIGNDVVEHSVYNLK